DLSKVKSLEIKVNSEEAGLNNFGVYVPNLETLKLVKSKIHVLRDLGSSLKKLRILYMPRCELRDLDGITSFVSISQLYLAYNDITDISSFSLLDNLSVLDLEGNNINDIYQLSFLSFCYKMTTLTLEGNPICISPNRERTADVGILYYLCMVYIKNIFCHSYYFY
ncbi:hypothetical protein HELRODRAFT_83538, partial [Helobdella robusta]|uniref:Uncharacterized protein n=1 Tax=Helobdella robusta TaxID=6412 RepID=T1G568_HELRO